MLNKSIAYRLSIYISLAVISVFIAFIGIYILFQKELLQENIETEAKSVSSELRIKVDNYLFTTQELASNIAEQILYYGYNNDADLFVSRLMEKYAFLNAIHVNIDSTVPNLAYHNYFILRDSSSLQLEKGNSEIYDCPHEKEIIKRLSKTKQPGWAEPFICPLNNIAIVSYYTPIYLFEENNDTLIIGEVIVELNLHDLNNSINEEKIRGRGAAFLVARNGDFITHPNEEWILKRNAHTIPKKVFSKNFDVRKVLEEQVTVTAIVYPEMLNYEKCWVLFDPLKEIGWSFIFVIPYNELYEPLFLPILQMLFFSVLGILTIYLLVTYISNKQIEPLNSLTQQLKTFSSLTGDESSIPENEISRIAESLNYMKWWYEKYKITRSEEAEESKTRKRDILQASEIQRSFIKMNFPAFPDRNDIDLYATYKPARGVSGDLFDYFFIDDIHLIFTIGDVSGKGVPAAFFMSMSQTIIKKNSNHISAKTIVEEANKELYTSNQHQYFLTLFLGVLNIETGELTYCNAAHTVSYILNGGGELLQLAQSHGLPLGLYPDKQYNETNIQLKSGDSIVLYTDGVTELQDENNLQYGNQKLEENLQSLAGLNPKEMVTRIEKSLELFIGETKQSDDISILILKYKA